MSDQEMEEFLSDQSEDGLVVDSGEFSVNWRKARTRLSSDNLIRPTAWVLYLVQAAVQWNCRSLNIVQSRYLTRFSFLFAPGDTPEAADFERAFSSLQTSAETPLEKLVWVVEHLRSDPENRFQVKFCKGDNEIENLNFGELHWYDRFRKQAKETVVIDINHWRKPDSEAPLPIFAARRDQLAIQTELDHYCGPCPVPITLDSVRFQGVLCQVDEQDPGQRVPWFMEAIRGPFPKLPKPSAFPEELEQGDGSVSQDDISGIVHVGLRLPPERRLDKLPAYPRSALLWVRHGVVVDTTRLKFRSRLLVVSALVSADDLAFDLTGFQLLEDKKVAHRAQAFEDFVRSLLATKLTESLVEEMEIDPKHHREQHPVLGPAMFLTLFAPVMAVGGLISFAGLPFLSPIILGVGGAVAGSGYWGYKNQPFQVPAEAYVEECKKHLNGDIRKLYPRA